MVATRIEGILRLPLRRGETWQGGFCRLPFRIGEAPAPAVPSAGSLWVAAQSGDAFMERIVPLDERDNAAAAADVIAFMRHKTLGGYRPGRIEVDDPVLAEELSQLLSPAEIEVACRERLPAVEGLLERMEADLLRRPGPPGILGGDGVSLDAVRAFAESAKRFYHAPLWLVMSSEDLVRVEQPQPPLPGLAFFAVPNEPRFDLGLHFFASEERYWATQSEAGEAAGAPRADRQPASDWSLSYESSDDFPCRDADLWERQRLPVACPTAFPLLSGWDAHRAGPVRPDVHVLAFVEGLLRTLADTFERDAGQGRWEKTVKTACGRQTFTLSLPFLSDPPTPQQLRARGVPSDPRALERAALRGPGSTEPVPSPPTPGVDEALEAAPVTGAPPDTATRRALLRTAQEFCYDAFESRGLRRVQLARQALATSAECADAHVILAERSWMPQTARYLYNEGVAAGERALEQGLFSASVGAYWAVVEARSCLRARAGLARALIEIGAVEEAVGHCRELLRLDAEDHLDAHRHLMAGLILLDRDAEAGALATQFPADRSSIWLYMCALVEFRLRGAGPSSSAALRVALTANGYTSEYLLGGRAGGFRIPAGYVQGTRREALADAFVLIPVWAVTSGAVDWLKSQLRSYRQRKERIVRRHRRGKGRR